MSIKDLGRSHLDLAELALTAPTMHDAWPTMVDHVLNYGADTHFIMHFNMPYKEVRKRYSPPEKMFLHKFPTDWLEQGQNDPEFVMEDPFARHAATSTEPLFMHTDRPEDCTINDAERAHVKRLRDSGLQSGTVIPLQNREEKSISTLAVGVGFDGPGNSENLRRNIGILKFLLTYFNEGLRLRDRIDEFAGSPLSSREQECLAWAAVGRTTSEISDVLSISENTVNEYIKSAAKKLGAANRTQACTRAFLLSLIEPHSVRSV